MEGRIISMCFFILCSYLAKAEKEILNDTVAQSGTSSSEKEFDLEAYQNRFRNQSKMFEKELKNIMKMAVKTVLRPLMTYGSDTEISSECMRSFMKYVSDLTNVKVWAMKMLDATSKVPAGLLSGTMSDFGAFDQCLDVELPKRGGGGEIEFRGRYCAVEITPKLPPAPRNLSIAKQEYALPLDSIGEEMRIAGMAFFYLKSRIGVCVPSTCSLADMKNIAQKAGESIDMEVNIPQCYVKETDFKPIHIAVICVVLFLLVICVYGSVVEYILSKDSSTRKQISIPQRIFCCFSLVSNFNRLSSSSKGSEELKALHGLRALSMAYVILGHTYIWLNFELLRGVNFLVNSVNTFTFAPVLNAWLAVEPFFFLSGLLTSYAAMKVLPKMNGRINVPLYILRRYIRITPSLLLTMGLAFFMPLVSSGPFWYDRVEPELRSCTSNWWASLLYISNWMGVSNICVHPTWSQTIGVSFIVIIIVLCNGTVGFLTYVKDLPPSVPLSSGNDLLIQDTIDTIHLTTFTHAGPYYVGFITGILMLKYKHINMNKVTVTFGWAASIILALASVYGFHRWNIGEPHGMFLTLVFAALHRTTFIISIAWVTFACVTGHGGIVNRILSSPVLAPFSRLTFMAYLMQSLVIWVRMGSMRERIFYSYYNVIYEYIGNIAFTFVLSVPFYLIVEAPVSNMERLLLSRAPVDKEETAVRSTNGHLHQNLAEEMKQFEEKTISSACVELKSVKVMGQQNQGFEDGSKLD